MKKRIIHLTKYLPGFPGGIEHVTKSMGMAGVAAGATVNIVGINPKLKNVAIEIPPEIQLISVREIVKFSSIPIAPEFLFLDKYLAGADIIHIHLPNPLAELGLLFWLLRGNGRPGTVIIPVIHAPIEKWNHLGLLWMRVIQSKVIRRANRVLFASPQLLTYMSARWASLDQSKVRIIPFGIPQPGPVLARPNGTADAKLSLLSIGRLVSYKGTKLLIDALASINGEWHLTLVGSGKEAGTLHRQISRLGLSNRVSILEKVGEEEKYRLLERCDIFIFPSQTPAESFGLAMGEAFAYGKPVITTDLPTGVAFLARSGECGRVVPIGSIGVLREAILELMNSKSRRDQAGKANYQFWERELSMRNFFSRYKGLIEETEKVDEEGALRRSRGSNVG